ncbi:chemotaxis protein CheW [Candidatus Methylospira mobilis]|uniref:Chemotaxis protein CheW n=1 Tax=Candidatus Methylospira mobilis TaxID=1808979 RepID=A0A5Q0BGD2_9GAMM|nr:chemotaxis protein CheW [Candidatus Methylospira mobilis]QFY42893.1 chemotaxis protein CheW [Candidatus Methylospira mobilis]WNV04048.1 chemotaxis protein CheW [Candidatus Methylospira mobilis]
MTAETLEQPENSASSESDALQAQESNVRQFVTFIVDDEVFAVDMAPVQEIIRVPDVVRVPLAPLTLDGLANLRGKVLPIISLRRIFGFPERDDDDATRAVVIDLGQPLGFVVDHVASVVGVEIGKIEDVSAIRGTVNTELLAGLLKDAGGHAMIMVLDFGKLIASEFAEISALSRRAESGGRYGDTANEAEKSGDELQLVSFAVAGQEYAITIDDVQEIVQMPEHIMHVPHAESHVLGVMTLRNRLLPLVSLRRMFALLPQDADERSRIVVVTLGAISVGVVMDSVNEVLRVPKTQVDAMPGLLARDGELSEITQICRLDGGKRLVSIISAGNIFRHSAIKEALSTVEKMQDDNAVYATGNQQDDLVEDDEQMVVFRLGKEEFGVPIESVQEIVRVPDELTHVPKAPAFVEGVINLRGAVLPVIDQRLRLGLETVERNEQQRIMVYLFDNVRTGFIVDSVTEVLKIRKDTIEASPHLSGEQARLIARVANLEKQKRIIQLIDPSRLMEGQDMQGLAALAG